MTNEAMIKLYVDTVNGPVNGWGQCLVRAPGTPFDGKQSHCLLYAIKQRMGWNTADEAIKAMLNTK